MDLSFHGKYNICQSTQTAHITTICHTEVSASVPLSNKHTPRYIRNNDWYYGSVLPEVHQATALQHP